MTEIKRCEIAVLDAAMRVCVSEALFFTAITQYHHQKETPYCTLPLFHGGVTLLIGVKFFLFKKNPTTWVCVVLKHVVSSASLTHNYFVPAEMDSMPLISGIDFYIANAANKHQNSTITLTLHI